MQYQMSALFTDFYELTMAQGFWKKNMNNHAVFDMFFRRQPFKGGFSVFSGINPLLNIIENFRFSHDDIAYLASLNMFDEPFLHYLENFRFSGDIYAMAEGSIIFPNEPIIRVHANLIEAQLIEGIVLNHINFESLIATKSARVYLASQKGHVMEFGLRRAQGSDGALSATRASFVGGASATSNTLAGKIFGIPVQGTMAHSWIMSFESELEAFRAYSEIFPEHSHFLIDTYETLGSGIKNAIIVGKELLAKGYNFGVRLDSGDIQYLSTEVRKKLDKAGFPHARISVSNELTEEIIETLVLQKAPIDSWGVGTHLATGGSESSFTGVYKLAACSIDATQMMPTMKFSDNPEKTTNPGIKNVYRLYDTDGTAKADILTLDSEKITEGEPIKLYHPSIDYRNIQFVPAKIEPLLKKCMSQGKRCSIEINLIDVRENCQKQLDMFDASYKRLLNPHIYKVSISEKLKDLKLSFLTRITSQGK